MLFSSTAGNKCKLIKIDTQNIAMVFTVGKDSSLFFDYFGPSIDDASPFFKKQSYRRDDYGTDPLVYPVMGGRNFKQPALSAIHADGGLNTELMCVSIDKCVVDSGNVDRYLILLKDRKNPFYVELILESFYKENVITEKVKICHNESAPIVLRDFYSGYLPIRANKYYLNSFSGGWGMEMKLEETLLTHGLKRIESRKEVRATQAENPSFMLSLDVPLSENYGHVIGGALAWSGNFALNFELDEFNILNIIGGINSYSSEYTLEPNQEFYTPEMIFTYSTRGAGDITRNLHDWARNHLVYDSKSIRPIVLNSWEGTYFNYDEKVIKRMIDDSKALGVDFFVLDDGWFGNVYPRNNSKEGLGDWVVNKQKLPSGLTGLASYAHRRGMKFGIWIEPEMLNPDSELAHMHPDWIVQEKGRPLTTIRDQLLLDLTNPDVQDFVFSVFDYVMKQSPYISYIKWDANRHVESAGSLYLPTNKQSYFWIEYVRGLYSVYGRIREKYPNVIIEACASGGGRVDYGVLRYHQAFWTSDNTDPRSRIFIQYGTNMIYPALATDAHVSISPNHQTNNQTPLKFRFDVAMSACLGIEFQPNQMTEKDLAFSEKAIKEYRKIQPIVLFGDLYRTLSPYDNHGYSSLMYVSKDKREAVLFVYCFEFQGRNILPRLKLNGLDCGLKYRIEELNVDSSVFWGNGSVFSGQYLTNEGISPKLQRCYDSAVFLIKSVE